MVASTRPLQLRGAFNSGFAGRPQAAQVRSRSAPPKIQRLAIYLPSPSVILCRGLCRNPPLYPPNRPFEPAIIECASSAFRFASERVCAKCQSFVSETCPAAFPPRTMGLWRKELFWSGNLPRERYNRSDPGRRGGFQFKIHGWEFELPGGIANAEKRFSCCFIGCHGTVCRGRGIGGAAE